MSDLNVMFSNCFNFINNTKQYLEANPTDWRNVYTEEALARAECDLMEMELEADYDAEEYDALLNGNAFRSSKRAQRRKANIRHHKADRKHGKPVPQSDNKYWDEQSGTFYRWDEKKKTFSSPKKPKVHRNRKTFRDRLDSAMDAREQDYILSPDPIEELWNAYWLHRDAECRLNHKADEPLYLHRTQSAYEEAIKEWEKLSEEEYNTYLEVDGLLYSLGLDWNYFEEN